MSLSFSAVLLAAGRSTRMGRDKALLPVNGVELWRRQWALLVRSGAPEIMLSARSEQTWVPSDVPVVRDAKPDAGPLAGIAAALAQMRGTHLIVLAVDLPRMEAAWLARMKSLCAPGVGAVGRLESFYEPLAAIYPLELLGSAGNALANGEHSLQHFIGAAGPAMQSVEISEGEAAWFANWNEGGDLAEL